MIGLSFRELLPPGVDLELDAVLAAVNATIEQEHDGDTGAHTAITCDSLSTRRTDRLLPIDGRLTFTKGSWLFDAAGNQTHVIGLRPPQWTASVNDYNPAGLVDAVIVEVETDADRNITGLDRGQRQKRLLIFGNRGNYTVTLKHNNASSQYYNRFGCPNAADVSLGSNEYIWLYYDVGSEIWRVVSVL